MTSFTVSFTGTSSVLQADFLPEITLDPDSSYCCGLLDFASYNSIPNVTHGKNNEFQYRYYVDEKRKEKGKEVIKSVPRDRTISLPTGSYEVEDILKYLKFELGNERIYLTYEISVETSKVRIGFSTLIEWTGGTVLDIIGFQRESSPKFERNVGYWSTNIVKITQIDIIRIECDIISDSYINGKQCHTIHQFSHCKVAPGYKFIEVPHHIIYLPIKEKQLRTIQISVVDQNGNPIDFRGEQISCRIHIRKA